MNNELPAETTDDEIFDQDGGQDGASNYVDMDEADDHNPSRMIN